MKITMTCPAFAPNGGIRILIDVAHELAKTHEVQLFCPDINSPFHPVTLKVINHTEGLRDQDILIICSPHHIHLKDLKIKAKKFAYIQMIEHLFQPGNMRFKAQSMRFYRELPFITMAEWGLEEILKYGNRNPYLYTANSVNFDHFPIVNKRKKTTVLLESPMAINGTKDKNQIGLKIGRRLKDMGYKVVGYGAIKAEMDEFHVLPDIETMNRLYSDAMIMIKATVLDFQSAAPLEAGTKGCVTVRGINKGDDNLIHEINCLRVPYNEDLVFEQTLRILKDEELRKTLAGNMIKYLKENPWEKHVKQIEQFICTSF